jgi:transmembrane sensor
MITESDWVRLARYVAGECTPDEGEATRRWIAASSERQQLAEEMRAIDAAASIDHAAWNTPGAWERLVVRAESRPAGSARARQRRPMSLATTLAVPARRSRVWMIAVAAAVVLAAGTVVRLRVVAHEPSVAASPVAAPREFTTRRAQLAQVRLSDGSTVDLAPESRLTVPADYGSARRDVTIDGEGFFAAVHDARLPFIVHSGSAVVHDIGTKFVVRHYAGDSLVRVVVSEGSVRLRGKGAAEASGLVLTRGDLGRVNYSGAVAISHGVELDRYVGWTSGRLTFSDAPLGDALAQLGRWYDVRFVLGDSVLKNRRITMSVPTTSIDALVDGIGLALDLRAERRGDTIVLRARTR